MTAFSVWSLSQFAAKVRNILGAAFHSCGGDDSDGDDDDDDAAGDDDARTICSNGGCGVGALGGS